APFAGVAIYNILESNKEGSGSLVFALTLAITTTGALGFLYLYTQLKNKPV
ncbi:MAG: hypothetical protein JKX70_11520, partial [Phycisphaerales bacterium]|nr:hypothetical protein [Phycisphaerales bacterium]